MTRAGTYLDPLGAVTRGAMRMRMKSRRGCMQEQREDREQYYTDTYGAQRMHPASMPVAFP